jgi:Obg family GTPase CgtA
MLSKRNPNPEICESGEKRKKMSINLQLSLITDLALVGLPNAGKSSLIQTITNSNSKIDSYPFTTISPSLGAYKNDYGLVTICDLPGLISGAAEGTGLGKSVLRHLKNTKFIIYLLDPNNSEYDVNQQIDLLETEIKKFDSRFEDIQYLRVVNKSDLNKKASNFINISTLTNEGIDELIDELNKINFEKLKRVNKSFEKIFIEPDKFAIDQFENNWVVTGRKVDKITNLKGNSHEVLNEISYRFEKSSISNELKNLGIQKGDIVDLNGHEFSYE